MADKKDVTPEQLKAFRTRCMIEFSASIGDVYGKLAKEAGMSPRGVAKWFADPNSGNYRHMPWSVWRLWHIVLFCEDVQS